MPKKFKGYQNGWSGTRPDDSRNFRDGIDLKGNRAICPELKPIWMSTTKEGVLSEGIDNDLIEIYLTKLAQKGGQGIDSFKWIKNENKRIKGFILQIDGRSYRIHKPPKSHRPQIEERKDGITVMTIHLSSGTLERHGLHPCNIQKNIKPKSIITAA